MRALILNCTLKPSPAASNTEALARVLSDALEERGATCEMIRAVDMALLPGVSSDEGEGDEWPEVHEKLLSSEILVLATPTWFGQPSSVVKRVVERMDGMLSETAGDGRPVAFDRVAGFVVTGNEDGAHHVIAELAQAVNDIGYTVPAQAWTYWNKGPGPGPTYLETDEGHDWSARTARTAAGNLIAAAEALAAHPLPKPSR
jgi:multimeric flavodoxin WrbA